MKNAIGIYGMAGSGKTTLGLRLAKDMGFLYISFGEVIREYPAVFTGSVNASLAVQLIALKATDFPGIVISGFPVCTCELELFTGSFDLYRAFHLTLNDAVARVRFFQRGRSFDDEAYYQKRVALYRNVILPFVSGLSCVTIDTAACDEEEMFAIARTYV